jgi:hypothetical protein
MRPLGKALSAFLLTLAIAYVLSVVVQSILNGGDVLGAVVGDGWRSLFQGGAVSVGLFLIFLLFINILGRRRGSGSLFWINAGALVVAILVGTLLTLAVGAFFGVVFGGYTGLPVLGTVLAAGELFIGGLVALGLTHFAVFKPRATEFEP